MTLTSPCILPNVTSIDSSDVVNFGSSNTATIDSTDAAMIDSANVAILNLTTPSPTSHSNLHARTRIRNCGKRRKYDLTVYDVGGGPKIRGIWKDYVQESHAILYLVNGSDSPQRLFESRQELHALFAPTTSGHARSRGVAVLLIITHADASNCIDTQKLCQMMELTTLAQTFLLTEQGTLSFNSYSALNAAKSNCILVTKASLILSHLHPTPPPSDKKWFRCHLRSTQHAKVAPMSITTTQPHSQSNHSFCQLRASIKRVIYRCGTSFHFYRGNAGNVSNGNRSFVQSSVSSNHQHIATPSPILTPTIPTAQTRKCSARPAHTSKPVLDPRIQNALDVLLWVVMDLDGVEVASRVSSGLQDQPQPEYTKMYTSSERVASTTTRSILKSSQCDAR